MLTYKFSQDRLELFFGSIRGRWGFNNNSTARQFEEADKRLLVHSDISAANRDNAVNLEKITILSCTTKSVVANENGEDLEKIFKKRIIEIRWHGIWHFMCRILFDISGFVVKLLSPV